MQVIENLLSQCPYATSTLDSPATRPGLPEFAIVFRRWDLFMRPSAHDHYRAGGETGQSLGSASPDTAKDVGVARKADHQKVEFPVAGVIHNGFDFVACEHLAMDRDSLAVSFLCGLLDQGVKELVPLPLE